MAVQAEVITVDELGSSRFDSPHRSFAPSSRDASRGAHIPLYVRQSVHVPESGEPETELLFEKACAKPRIYFNPPETRAAIVTCGGLCPGLNNVVRSAFLELQMNYGVGEVLGIRYGYQGLNPKVGVPPLRLTLDLVETIHEEGGTRLGSSRGNQDPAVMADFLMREKIDILFCVGGDGTQRGAHSLAQEIARRGAKIAIIGIPKTIDNDIFYCDRSFGFGTAVAEAQRVLACAHVESKGAPMGVGLVKVMGRESGIVAATATLASQEVNFCLIPECPFPLEGENGFLAALRRRLLARNHAVVVVAEGAGQDLFPKQAASCDASGNVKLQDIGVHLRSAIQKFFDTHGPAINLKYIDPSYVIRSVPASCEDDILCDQYARRAVHAAMAGKTNVMVGQMSGTFALVPLALATQKKRHVDVNGDLWSAVLATTGQPILG